MISNKELFEQQLWTKEQIQNIFCGDVHGGAEYIVNCVNAVKKMAYNLGMDDMILAERLNQRNILPLMLKIVSLAESQDVSLAENIIRAIQNKEFYKNHYVYLEKNIENFFEKIDLSREKAIGLITAHGDKAYFYRKYWEDNGLHFYHGAIIFLLTYCRPYSEEVRETNHGWVDPFEWVLRNKNRFLPHLPPAE